MKDIFINKIYSILQKEFKNNKMPIVDLISIQTNDKFKVLIATILSARTKDETTANACKRLFSIVTNFNDLEKLSTKEIEKLIYPVGFYKNKAKFLQKLPLVIKEKFGGKIPSVIDDLLKLPGVGRKTANLVRAVAFNLPAVCVDVHVHRISNRLGYVHTKTPCDTEMALREKLPEKYWINWNKFLVSFGQNLCKPINPRCNECPIYLYCDRINVKKNNKK
jgi:endonuclease III